MAVDRPNLPLKVFINYRHDDVAGHALSLHDRLAPHFGGENVFLDVPSLAPGDDWLAQIKAHGAGGGAFLAVIGRNWLASLTGRRATGVAKPVDDFVRREIEWALRDWHGCVIPVLIDTTMPDPAQLPRSVRALTGKHAAQLHHTSFDHDVAGLIERLDRIAREGFDSEDPPRPADARLTAQPPSGAVPSSGVPSPHDDHYEEVLDCMLDARVVPLLGSCVRGALPDAEQLAAHIARRFNITRETYDLAEVAQYVAVTRGNARLYAAIREVLANEVEPNPAHRFLARLPRRLRELELPPRHQLIITTSYDSALERAFDDENEPYDLTAYMPSIGRFVHFPWGQDDAAPLAVPIESPRSYPGFPIDPEDGEVARTVIVKVHGTVDGQEGDYKWDSNYVVTEDQYIDYLPTDNISNLVPVQILAKLKQSHCLFLGYTMRDWNARVLLRRIWQRESFSENSWAIEYEPSILEKKSWGLFARLELLAAWIPAYVAELDARLDARRR